MPINGKLRIQSFWGINLVMNGSGFAGKKTKEGSVAKSDIVHPDQNRPSLFHFGEFGEPHILILTVFFL